MNTRFFAIIIGIVGISAFAAGCGKASETNENANTSTSVTNDAYDINAVLANIVTNDTNSDVFDNANDTPLNVNSSTNTNTTTSNTNTSTSNTNSAVTNTPTTNGSLTVTLPAPNTALTSPFMVEGTADTGTQVFARVRSANGTTIFTEKISVNNKKFKGKLLFDFTSTRAGFLDVFQKDSNDEETNLITVPVTFTLAAANANSNTNTSN